MIKKLISAILCLLMLFPIIAYAEQENETEIYYAADFGDNELPPGSDVTFGEDGFIFAEDGKLRLEAAETYPPVSTVLFPYENEADEYIYECEITVLSSLSGGCWFSLCFGAVNDNILYLFTVKCGAEEEDSVSLQYKNGASSWKMISRASLSDFIGEDGIATEKFKGGMIKNESDFKISVAVKDGVAFGRAGLNGHGVTVLADNVRISSDIPSYISAADSFSAKLYTPDSGLVGTPAVVQRDRLSMPVFSENMQRPQAVIMTVKSSGDKLHGYDGAVDLGELDTRIKAFADLAIPAFYVSDEQSAAMLSAFIEEKGYSDCFVTVSKASLLDTFKGNKYLRTILDMSSRDSVSAADISGILYSNGCRTVMLSETAADAETVFELHKRLVSVWVNGTAGVDSLFDSAVNGADALVTSEAQTVLSAFEKVKDTVVVRRRVITADLTGSDITRKDVLSALDAGVSAVRTEVRYVKENGTYLIGDNTALEEIFEAVYKEYPQSVFHLDIQDLQTLSGIIGLIKEYEMSERCVILSTDIKVLKAAAAEGMPSAYTGGPYTADGRKTGASLSSLCRILNGYNSAYYSDADKMPEELIRLMRSRGMYVCTVYGEGDIPVTSGSDAFTTKTPSRIAKLAASLEASADENGRLSAKVRYCDGTELDVTALCSIVTVSGDVRLSGGTVTGSGAFTVLCPQTTDSTEKYGICSKLINVYEDPSDTDTGDDTEKTDNNTLTTVIIVVSSAAAAAGVIILLYLTGKKRKNDKKQPE